MTLQCGSDCKDEGATQQVAFPSASTRALPKEKKT